MNLADLSPEALLELASRGIKYRTGSFCIELVTDIPELALQIQRIYGATELLDEAAICHFHLRMMWRNVLRRFVRPQVVFEVGGFRPFEPFPADHALPYYEWGLNWCIATSGHNHLMLHSAALEKNGQGLILPALPGSGKSTLCAGLVANGWRLLSDEFAIIRTSDGKIMPLPRAAPLKNNSIELVRNFAPNLTLGPRFERTRKGTVAHFFPPDDAITRQQEVVAPKWIVFPKFQAGADTQLTPYPMANTLNRLVNNSFNYLVTMEHGFISATRLVRQCERFEFINGDLRAAVDAMNALADGAAA
jgi:HprK-related kinase A